MDFFNFAFIWKSLHSLIFTSRVIHEVSSPIFPHCFFFSPGKLGTYYPKRDKELITNECSRCSSQASLFPVVGGTTMGNDNTSAKNKHASRYHALAWRSMRFTAIAFLPNYRLIKISRRRVTRDAMHVGVFIYLSRRHMRARARLRDVHISADLVNILCKYLRMLRRRIKIDFRTFQRHFIKFVGKLCEKIAHMVSLTSSRNTCFT